MRRGHRGIQQIFDLDAPIIVAHKGWSIGGSFQRALLCDIRIAAEGARFMLPEVGHGVIPDTGGVGRLFQICGHGVVSDMVLTGRPMDADEALAHGVVSRDRPARPARRHGAGDGREDRRRAGRHREDGPAGDRPPRRARGSARSMADELIAQTFISRSDDYAEMRAARAEDRAPPYTGS